VAFDTVRVRAAQLPPQGEGWRDLLADMQPTGGAVWRTENGVTVSSGERGLLVSKRGDFKNFSWRARLRINHGGESGLLFRADTSDPPSGYEAPVTSSSEVPVKTGSLAGLWLVKTRLVPPNTWFTEQVTCEDVPDGVHIVIAVNDVVIADCIDKKQLHGPGHLAFEHRGPGTSVQIKDALVREW
jgi:hypothetical protein